MKDKEKEKNKEKAVPPKVKKKNRKLLFQISIIIIPVFIMIMSAMTWSMYNTTVTGFLEAQDAHMDFLLNDLRTDMFGYDEQVMDWCFDQWERNPMLMREELTPEENAAVYEHLNDTDMWSREWIERMPETVQRYGAKMFYQSVKEGSVFETERNNYESMFIMDVTEGYEGFVISEYNKSGHAKQIGDYYDIDISEHPAITELIETCEKKSLFERTDGFPEYGNYYVGYQPVVINGRTRAVIGIVYNWDAFQKTVVQSLKKTVFVSIGGLLFALLILQASIFLKAISPIARIQGIVRNYTENKNSDEVAEKMAGIKSRNELGLLSDDIAEMTREIDYYTKENIKLAGERERVAAELDMATKIQASQLPGEFPAFPDRKEFDIYASMTPAKEVGGDFYDFFLIDDDHLALVIADVSGKGIPASLFMMMTKMLINEYAMMGLSPREVLERTNLSLCKNNKQEMFVTVWFGILEISTGRITASNAGHEYPMIRRPDGEFELFKDKHCFVIGAIKSKKYKEYEFTLPKGGTLFVYTDGVPEATDADENMFGTDRLAKVLNIDPDAPPKQLLESVKEKVDEFVGDAPQFDDLTMLGIKLF